MSKKLTLLEKDILNSAIDVFISSDMVEVDKDIVRILRSIAQKLNLRGDWLEDLKDIEENQEEG